MFKLSRGLFIFLFTIASVVASPIPDDAATEATKGGNEATETTKGENEATEATKGVDKATEATKGGNEASTDLKKLSDAEVTTTATEAAKEGNEATEGGNEIKTGETAVNDKPTDAPVDVPAGSTNGGEAGETTTAVQENVETAILTLDAAATTPKNVITNRYGEPVKSKDILKFSLANGAVLEVFTEHWMTYHTFPATKPGCMCLTRGPLPKFKLIGNIHFPKIKVTPPRYVTESTEPTSTLCPPCVCPNCGVGAPPIDTLLDGINMDEIHALKK